MHLLKLIAGLFCGLMYFIGAGLGLFLMAAERPEDAAIWLLVALICGPVFDRMEEDEG